MTEETTRTQHLHVHDQIAAQAARTPDAIALVYGDEHLSYAELDGRANQLARHLQSLGLGPDLVVAICMERTPAFIIALLSILKAGAAYMPLDPDFPTERLAFMLEDSKSPLLLTQERLLPRLPANDTPRCCIDGDWATIAQQRTTPPPTTLRPANLAYIIYTSGSTGRPKGVALTHEGLRNYVEWCLVTLPINEGEGSPIHSSLSFDLTITNLYPALVAGKRIVLVPENAGPDGLRQAFASVSQFGVVKLTPSHLRLLAHTWPAATPVNTRAFVIGGEQLRQDDLAFWQTHAPNTRLINHYGPTETVVGCCTYDATHETGPNAALPIGRPITNMQLYVLDDAQQPTADGANGELYVGGIQLARGYHARPALTAQRFVPNPFNAGPGTRLYRTGDQARRRPDGAIEFLGRFDTQVKIRGYRIELGEIEAALRHHAEVRDAVVTVQDGPTRDKQIVAYVVRAEGSTASAAAWRHYLAQQLPPYMMPAAFAPLDKIPLTLNGKVDFAALPQPDQTASGLTDGYMAPATAAEQAIAAVWAEVLHLSQVSTDHNFFALGGHSLLAAQVVTRLRPLLARPISILDIFEHPTIGALAGLLEESAAPAHGTPVPRDLPLQPVSRGETAPLTFGQEQVVFLSRLAPGLHAYNAQMIIDFSGRFDVAVMEKALTEIIHRHEILRTVFTVSTEGEATQTVRPPYHVPLAVIDLRATPPARQEHELQSVLDEIIHYTFDIGTLPLIRWTLISLPGDRQLFLQVQHHLIHDGWSDAILLREIKDLYNAFSAGRPSPLPPLPIQLADYAIWQRARWERGLLADGLAYWEKTLEDAPALLRLPYDRPRPPAQTFHGKALFADLNPTACRALGAFSEHHGVTPFMVLLAVFKTLLYRYSGEHDIVVGSALANRTSAQVDTLIGMLVNTVPLRTQLTGDLPFLELLHRIREETLEAYLHEDIPILKLVQHLRPQRDPSYSPLFQVLFSFHDSPVPDMDLRDLHGTVSYPDNGSAKFDLDMMAYPHAEQRAAAGRWDDGLTLKCEFNTDLFDQITIARFLENYTALLQAILRDPNQKLATLPLSEAQRQQELRAYNQGTVSLPHPALLHCCIATQAASTPERVAARSNSGELSYRQLDQDANRLAHYLQARGIGPDTPVGICLYGSLDLSVATLAVLKAGGAIVLLDPAQPRARLQQTLDDAGAPLAICAAATTHLLPAGIPSVQLDTPEPPWRLAPRHAPGSTVQPDNTAYIMFTSGSTGRPKGCMISHQNLLNMLQWMQKHYHVTGEDRALQRTPPSFDPCMWELFLPLLAGGTVIHVAHLWTNPGQIRAAITEHQVTLLDMVPSLFSLIAADPPTAPTQSLRLIFCGGETLPPPLIAAASNAFPGAQLDNSYGPTETTIVTAATTIPPGTTPARIPIGCAVDNTQLYVLDPYLQPQPLGLPGELYIGGLQVGRGYAARAALTAERFIPDPYSPTPGSRLYKTGDLVRRLPDGALEFLGRLDHQIKLHGQRIELGEIEAALRSVPGVRDALVTLHTDPAGSQHLAAYLVAEESAPNAATLREHLRDRLPRYMLPASFTSLDAFPSLPNGKLDRKALPAPTYQPDQPQAEPPATPLEEQVLAAWQRILHRTDFGVTADFFSLGGDSLAAIRLASALQADHLADSGVLQHIFATPTVRDVAAYLQAQEEMEITL